MSPQPVEPVRHLADRYSDQAGAYEELWAPILRELALRLLAGIDRPGLGRVLDIGAGVGAMLPDLRRIFPGAIVVGADRSAGMLALAPKEFPLAVMDASRLAFAPRTFDLALLIFMLFHLSEPQQALLEARRVLRQGGTIGAVTWGSELESAATSIWSEELDSHGAAPLDAEGDLAHHELVDSPDKLAQLLASAGFVSSRTWIEHHRLTIELDHLVRLRTRLGRNKRRFDSLPLGAQSACLASAQRRLASLPREGFAAQGDVVYALASAQ